MTAYRYLEEQTVWEPIVVNGPSLTIATGRASVELGLGGITVGGTPRTDLEAREYRVITRRGQFCGRTRGRKQVRLELALRRGGPLSSRPAYHEEFRWQVLD